MRWDGLFADLEAQSHAMEVAERAAEVDERARAEIGRARLVDRLRPAIGSPVRVRAAGGLSLAGRLTRVGPDWLLLDEGGGREALVLLDAVLTVAGLDAIADVPDTESVVAARLTVRSALRGVARDRLPVRLTLRDGGSLDGTLDRAASDHVEVALHAPGEWRRRGAVRETVLVPLAALVSAQRLVG